MITPKHPRWDTTEDREESAKLMTTLARRLYDSDHRRREIYRRCVALLGVQIGTTTGTGTSTGDIVEDTVLGGSILKRTLRAQLPRITSARPRPSVMTNGGTALLQYQGQQLEKFLIGDWERAHAYQQYEEAAFWGGVCGTGVVLITDDEQVGCESLYPWDLLVDPLESKTGMPRRWYRRILMDRYHAQQTWPEYEEELDSASRCDPTDPVIPDAQDDLGDADYVEIWEAWSCGKGGKHVVACGDICLVHDEWKEAKPPIELYQWCKPLRGIWADGVAMDVAVHQMELDAIGEVVRKSLRAAVPFMWLPSGCQFSAEQMDDRVGKVLQGGSAPPQWLTFEAVAQSYLTWLQHVSQDAYQAAGISQMSAAAEKPTGLTAAAALQQWSDLDDLRNLEQAKAFDDLVVRVAEQWVLAAKRLHKSSGYKVTVYDEGAKFGETIDWGDVDLERDTYSIRIFSASSLPSHPAARQQIVADWFNAGLIDKQQYLSLLGFPDVQKATSIETAPLDYALRTIESILYRGEQHTPIPEMGDQKLIVSLSQRSLVRALADGLDERDDRIEALRTYIAQCVAMQQEAAEATAALAPPPAPAAAPAVPLDAGAMPAGVLA